MTAIWEQLNKSNLLASVLVFVTACFLLNAFSRLYRRYTQTFGINRGERSTAVQVVYGLFRVLVICGSLFGILQINGIDVSSMLAGVGLISAFIGLAVQDLLKDIVMGTRMLTDRFFDVGDVVQYGSFEGQVESFDIRSTKIRNLNDGRVLTVCNRNISEITAYPAQMKTTVSLMLPLTHDPAAIGAALRNLLPSLERMEGLSGAEYVGLTEVTGGNGRYAVSFISAPQEKEVLRVRVLNAMVDALRADALSFTR